MKPEISKLAKLLRTSDEVVLELEKKMEQISGKKGVIEKIVEENDKAVKRVLKQLKLKDDSLAELVFAGLINKVKEVDKALLDRFYKPEISTEKGCRSLINVAKELTGDLSGFFLKQEKAKELFRLNPPKQVMASLGYGSDLEKMLVQEDIFELFAALRIVEDSHWMNDVFLKPYQDLTKDDFEKRDIKVMVLPEKWVGIGQKFLGKKLHHMSHLKEMGLVFIIPVVEQHPGEIIYLFFMTLHYIYEVDWHARLFERYSKESDFVKKMIGALKVETSGLSLPDHGKMSWRIIPSYLAKKDKQDPRLAEPHINPEAWHYSRAAETIWKFADRFPETGLGFWKGLEVSGDCFPSNGSENLISFDLFDNGISLLQQIGFESKYLYHQQEALWNKVFSEYMGEETMDKLMMDNLDKGFITL
ncbi:hypothetical protein KKH07_02750 [Patescibacteria group bacterium]|nr:hypothetical protein [Patescibacteria group bacterium]MBU1563772.1 hypothetical protein [Patescibacteria group bacterium]MBU2068224.1 hypothetical protein [Patescibacteria group bacterium]